jgi:oxygen-independent coproporphyrinogen-3 oxidase
LSQTLIDGEAALEESFFLGLRMNRGIRLPEIADRFGEAALHELDPALWDLAQAGLLERDHDRLRLTSRGRLLSNEAFARFIKDGSRARHESKA